MTHIANDYETLLDYLYEEGEPDQRRQIERHLAECKPCADVVRDFRSVRGQLGAWAPPTPQLGFKVVQELPPVSPDLDPFGKLRVDGEPTRTIDGLEPSRPSTLRESQGRPEPGRGTTGSGRPELVEGRAGRGTQKQGWRLPVTRWSTWAQAAAALVLFVSGMAVSQLNVQYANGGLTVSLHRASGVGRRESLGQANPKSQEAGAVAAPRVAASANATSPEEMLRRALASAAGSQPGSNAAADSDALLRRVQAMIDRSEQRQQQELALRLAQVVRDFDAQRRADLLRVEQNFGQLEGQTGAAMAQQRDELLNYLVRVSQSQK